MSLDTLFAIAKVGGIPLVMIVLCFVLLKFTGGRLIKSFDQMSARVEGHAIQITNAHTQAMREIAQSLTASTAASVAAITLLTDRVSRMEGVVAGLGLAAMREQRSEAYEWNDEGDTPVGPPPPPQPQQRPIPQLPAGGRYHVRAATEPGKKR